MRNEINVSLASPSSQNFSTSKHLNTSINTSFGDESNEIWLGKPKDWSDDVRMNALFAPFRNRDLNPLHYDNKLKFWKEVIQSYCNEKNIIQFSLRELETYFRRKNVKPKCLELVINEMVKEKTLSKREDILRPRESIIKNMFNKLVWSPVAWSTNFLLKSITSPTSTSNILQTSNTISINESINSSKSLDHLSTLSDNAKKEDCYFVFNNLIETKSQQLLKMLQDKVVYRNVDALIDYQQIYSLEANYSDFDLDLLIKYLLVFQKILIDDRLIDNKKLLKFTLNVNSNVESINEMELSFFKLKQTEKRLEIEANRLSDEINNLNNNIKDALKQNNKNLSLKFLKKRKQLEKSLENKDATIANLQSVIMSIQQTDTNQITYDVYKKSVNVLKEVNKDINTAKVDETMMDLQELVTSTNEIEQTLAYSPFNSPKNSYIDDLELNKELEELLNDTKSEKLSKNIFDEENKNENFDLNDLLNSLPKIPVNLPAKASKLSYNS